MHADPRRDWLDELLAQQPSWDPPADFAARVATQAVRMPIEPGVSQRLGWASYAADLAQGLRGRFELLVMARLEGITWVVRQYWMVFQR